MLQTDRQKTVTSYSLSVCVYVCVWGGGGGVACVNTHGLFQINLYYPNINRVYDSHICIDLRIHCMYVIMMGQQHRDSYLHYMIIVGRLVSKL